MKNSAGSVGYIFPLLKYYIMLSNLLPLKHASGQNDKV